jgi:outer membrane protein OmpA-like peptidoglycan-associated protein
MAAPPAAMATRIYFTVDSSDLTFDQREKLRILAVRANKEGFSLSVTGHADPRGTKFYNEHLSRTRALRVAEALRSFGARVSSVSAGPLFGDSTDQFGEDRFVEVRPHLLAGFGLKPS